jgi:hypothetical protein
VGAAYYLAPYNQGDFQARAFLGGGLVSLTGSKAAFEVLEFATDSATTLGDGSFLVRGRGQSPGYYLEAGAHMWFPLRYSVMLGVMWRSAVIRDMVTTYQVVDPETFAYNPGSGTPPFRIGKLDVGGLSARLAIAIGL